MTAGSTDSTDKKPLVTDETKQQVRRLLKWAVLLTTVLVNIVTVVHLL